MVRFLSLIFFLTISFEAHAAPNAEDILRRADEARLPSTDYTVLSRVTSIKPGKEPKIGIYDVMSKGKERTAVKTMAPPNDKGRVLLMRDNNLWIYIPNVSKPIRVSLRERLIGEVSNADIARANFVGDYNPAIDGEETIDGKKHLVLALTAVNDSVTYAKVRLWVEADSNRPKKAEFFGASGRLLKGCTFERYAMMGGRMRPTRVVMNDPLVKGQSSVIEYAKMEVKALPDKYFTDEYMKKLAD